MAWLLLVEFQDGLVEARDHHVNIDKYRAARQSTRISNLLLDVSKY